MAETVDSVKVVAAFLLAAAEKNQNPETRALLNEHARTLEWAVAELVRLKGLTSALPPDLGNIYDLPQELLDELSVAKGDELEDQLVTVVNAYGGEASLDQILVGLFRKFGSLQKRRFIQNKLYRMEMMWSVEGRKGFYTTTKPEVVTLVSDAEEHPNKHFTPSDIEDEVPF